MHVGAELASSSSYRYRYPKSARALSELKRSCSTAVCDCDSDTAVTANMACVTILTQATLNARDSKKIYITNFNLKSVLTYFSFYYNAMIQSCKSFIEPDFWYYLF